MLVDGKWIENWQPVQKADEKGRFVRQVSSFRTFVTVIRFDAAYHGLFKTNRKQVANYARLSA
ncbi:hypothetical protein ATER59S_00047 [Aquamicrobium terrae]